jgi:hypothetical protein
LREMDDAIARGYGKVPPRRAAGQVEQVRNRRERFT